VWTNTRKLRKIGTMNLTLRFHDFRFLPYEILRSLFSLHKVKEKFSGTFI